MTATAPDPCPSASALAGRRELSDQDCRRLERLFRWLGGTSRLRLVHALVRAGEVSLTELAATVGLRPQAAANQLGRMVAEGALSKRRDGREVRYRLRDPCLVRMLELGLCLIDAGGSAQPAALAGERNGTCGAR